MNRAYVVYRPDGSIDRFISCPPDMLEGNLVFEEFDRVIEGPCVDSTQMYVDPATGVIKPKMASPVTLSKTAVVADGVDTAVLAGIIPGSTLRITGAGVQIDQVVPDAQVELTFDASGQYWLTVIPPVVTYLPFAATIDAT